MAKKAVPKAPDDSALAECLLRAPTGEPVRQVGTTTAPGLFPSGAPGKALLERALALGYAEECDPPPAPPPKRKTANPPKPVPHARVTAQGRDWALQQASPRKALEGLLTALQSLGAGAGRSGSEVSDLQAQLADLQLNTQRLQQAVLDAAERRRRESERLNETVQAAVVVAQRLVTAGGTPAAQPSTSDGLRGAAASYVREWGQQRGVGCPLPDLFTYLRGRSPSITIGSFHDLLRSMHSARELRLSGVSGSLEELRSPELALLVSNKVMYYANSPDGAS